MSGNVKTIFLYVIKINSIVCSYHQAPGSIKRHRIGYLKSRQFGVFVNQQIQLAFGGLGVPAHFFIGRDGRIRSIQVGTLTPERIDAALATIR